MPSTQHQLIKQCATRLRGIVEALDNIHDSTPHRWSTDLDDVHSSAESLLALIKDQAPVRSEASFEEWLANELEGEDGQPVPAAVCDIALARRAFNHWPKLEHPAKVGGVRFSAGVSSRLVVEAAQRLNEFESTPEQEAERPEMSPERAAYFMRRFKSEEKLLGPNEQAAVDYVLSLLAQHDRIVGAVLRQKHEADTALAWATRHYQTVEQQRDAALARVAEQQTEIEWLKNPKALAETVHADAQEAVKLQRLLMDSHTACRPAGEGLMGWAHAALSAQAQHSVPDGYRLIRLEHFAAIKAQLNPEQVDAYRGRNIYDEDKVYANWNACRSALDEIKDVFQQIDWDAENELAELLAAAPGNSVPQAWLDVQAERRRQVEAEGWTPEHDDGHSHGQMARAAACYALACSSAPNDGTAALLVSLAWPWDEQWWKPSTARRDLIKAGALVLAEIERLDRAGISQSPQPGATTASS
ncbi:TPA: hypothetical protein ACID0O_000844 [Pseudomonas aeruginosa]|uniref:hypothetical protein n=1 Tax=Pseudomonas aeruginosa TaxID=287 RepID=UPI0008B3FFA6|nr:hypothetical protein [Pseudomonas aeruginosa]OFP59009.1 hypothetical protein HMPREF2986_06810 [Pseudomonas aeruginosa]